MGGLRICDLRIYGLRIYSLRIYGLRICDLNNRGNLVRSVVRDLRVGYILASGVSSKAAWVYRINLVKWVRYKASNYIKFRISKEFLSSTILV